jgi:uncharacterized integral membrane protein
VEWIVPKIKIIIIAVLSLLALIVVLQNTESVSARILFWKRDVPLAALLFATLVVGFVLGIVVAGRALWKKREAKGAKPGKPGQGR